MTEPFDDALVDDVARAILAACAGECIEAPPGGLCDDRHCQCRKEARAALAVAVPRAAWQPIETAPEDGTVVLIYDPGPKANGGQMVVAEYFGGSWVAVVDMVYFPAPTHWMPLPEPPAIRAQEPE